MLARSLFSSLLITGSAVSVAETFVVAVDPPDHGRLTLQPPLPADGRYTAGTEVTVTATPDPGYVLDSGYYSVPFRWGPMYFEAMTGEFTVTIDRDKHIGASFIPTEDVAHVDVIQDVVYAKPGVKTLKYDVFSPKGAAGLPIIIIVHGGGWAANDENIMRGLARELTRDGRFVAVSIDYRWAGKLDGDAQPNTMADIIGDVFGAIAHVMEHAAEYGGDPTRIGVTGDSAGGHLSAAASLMIEQIGERGFGRLPGVFEFRPTYVPAGKTVAQVRAEMLDAIKAAAPSYGVFGPALLNHYSEDPAATDTWKQAIAPLSHIPPATVREVPQYLTRGTEDPLISDSAVAEFVAALVKAGQPVEYVQVGGASHAFFDWKPDATTKATFARYGVYYANEMRAFFASILY
ncbi:MAG: alpha/beta hydrolase [Gammaproteobacteria bacterium]|nr:alpha/beta hydrolase [Gammaproteobacteria bacterium]